MVFKIKGKFTFDRYHNCVLTYSSHLGNDIIHYKLEYNDEKNYTIYRIDDVTKDLQIVSSTYTFEEVEEFANSPSYTVEYLTYETSPKDPA